MQESSDNSFFPYCNALTRVRNSACYTDRQERLPFSEGPYESQSYQHQVEYSCLILLILVYVTFQSMLDSTVSTVNSLWTAGSAGDLSLLQYIHTSHITHTFSYSIGTTGPIPESGQVTSVTTHLQLL